LKSVADVAISSTPSSSSLSLSTFEYVPEIETMRANGDLFSTNWTPFSQNACLKLPVYNGAPYIYHLRFKPTEEDLWEKAVGVALWVESVPVPDTVKGSNAVAAAAVVGDKDKKKIDQEIKEISMYKNVEEKKENDNHDVYEEQLAYIKAYEAEQKAKKNAEKKAAAAPVTVVDYDSEDDENDDDDDDGYGSGIDRGVNISPTLDNRRRRLRRKRSLVHMAKRANEPCRGKPDLMVEFDPRYNGYNTFPVTEQWVSLDPRIFENDFGKLKFTHFQFLFADDAENFVPLSALASVPVVTTNPGDFGISDIQSKVAAANGNVAAASGGGPGSGTGSVNTGQQQQQQQQKQPAPQFNNYNDEESIANQSGQQQQ